MQSPAVADDLAERQIELISALRLILWSTSLQGALIPAGGGRVWKKIFASAIAA